MKFIFKAVLTTYMLAGLAIAANAQSNDRAAWRYSEKIDLMTDADSSYAFATQLGCTRDCGSIFVRADGAVIINFSEFMNTDDNIKLEYRFDKEPIKSMWLTVSTTGTSGFIKAPFIEKFIAEMMHYKTLVLRGYNFRGTPVTFKISLAGSKGNISEVAPFRKAKSMDTFIEEEAQAVEAAKERNVEALRVASLTKEEAMKEELKALRLVVQTVEKITGINSEAYKTVKAQYEAKVKETELPNK
jgi:hypothetical protein